MQIPTLTVIGDQPPVQGTHMAVRNPRSRMISIRLSEEEYVGLKKICAATGARSVSDLTRGAMRVVLSGVDRDDVLGMRMDQFYSALKSLDRKIDQLAAGISGKNSDPPEP